jgi:hypothetical protein
MFGPFKTRVLDATGCSGQALMSDYSRVELGAGTASSCFLPLNHTLKPTMLVRWAGIASFAGECCGRKLQSF